MATAGDGTNTDRVWLGDAYARLVKGWGSPQLAEKQLRKTSDPSSWGYGGKDGDAPDHEFWPFARFNYEENSGRVGVTFIVLGDDGEGLRSTEYYGVWLLRARLLELLPEATGEHTSDVNASPGEAKPKRRSGGRPREYDHAAIAAVAQEIVSDGDANLDRFVERVGHVLKERGMKPPKNTLLEEICGPIYERAKSSR